MTTAPDHDPTRVWLRRSSLAAGIAFTATAEYELARRLGAKPPIAVMLPLALDCYVIAALRWFRALDVTLSLGLMCAAQVAAHALEAGVIAVSFRLVVVISLLVPVALWRTHALARSEGEVTTPEAPHRAAQVVISPPALPALPDPLPFAWADFTPHPMTTEVTTSVPAVTPRQVVTAVVTLTPAELRKRALKLNREVVIQTGRPVTIDALRTELGLSRRDATALRREIVEGSRS
ncbi:hypothetical protein [Streptomyces sp. CA-106131]|uniref:hypothetical protein n=1 Tax=Streptomyces sp. CA-106131 TaxID=3240045 RepID=UPI003D8FDBA0